MWAWLKGALGRQWQGPGKQVGLAPGLVAGHWEDYGLCSVFGGAPPQSTHLVLLPLVFRLSLFSSPLPSAALNLCRCSLPR